MTCQKNLKIFRMWRSPIFNEAMNVKKLDLLMAEEQVPNKLGNSPSMPNIGTAKPRRLRQTSTKSQRVQPAWDLESLHDMLMNYKRKNFELELTKKHLKSQNQMKEVQIQHKDLEIEDILKRNASVGANGQLLHEKSLSKALKRELRLARVQITEQIAELNKIKSQLRITALAESKAESEEYFKEVQRLRLFNELGRTVNAHTRLPILQELKSLRTENHALVSDNAELNNRITQSEQLADQSRKLEKKQFAARIYQMEIELKKERMLVEEMEKIGVLSRQELDKVIQNTEGTRTALADGAAQIKILRERATALEVEIAGLKRELLEFAIHRDADMEAAARLRESIESKLLGDIDSLRLKLGQEQGEKQVLLQELDMAKLTHADASNVAEQEIHGLRKQITDTMKRMEEMTKALADSEAAHLSEIAELRARIQALDAIVIAAAEDADIKDQHVKAATDMASAKASYDEAKYTIWRLEQELMLMKYRASVADAERADKSTAQELLISKMTEELSIEKSRLEKEETEYKLQQYIKEREEETRLLEKNAGLAEEVKVRSKFDLEQGRILEEYRKERNRNKETTAENHNAAKIIGTTSKQQPKMPNESESVAPPNFERQSSKKLKDDNKEAVRRPKKEKNDGKRKKDTAKEAEAITGSRKPSKKQLQL